MNANVPASIRTLDLRSEAVKQAEKARSEALWTDWDAIEWDTLPMRQSFNAAHAHIYAMNVMEILRLRLSRKF